MCDAPLRKVISEFFFWVLQMSTCNKCLAVMTDGFTYRDDLFRFDTRSFHWISKLKRDLERWKLDTSLLLKTSCPISSSRVFDKQTTKYTQSWGAELYCVDYNHFKNRGMLLIIYFLRFGRITKTRVKRVKLCPIDALKNEGLFSLLRVTVLEPFFL